MKRPARTATAPDAQAPAEAEAALHRLLEACAGLDAEHREHGPTQLPLALDALHSLGAGAALLQAHFDRHAPSCPPAPPPAAWPRGEAWSGPLRGQPAAWPAYRWLFREWQLHEGSQAVLEQALPQLLAGCAAGGLHGLVRTGHAVHAGHGGELADALAYWACRWFPLGGEAVEAAPIETASATDDDPWRVLQRLKRAVPAPRPAVALPVLRLAAVAQVPGFAAAAARLRVTPDTAPAQLETLARLAAAGVARHGDPLLRQLLAGAVALQRLWPFLEDPVPALRHFWAAWAAGMLASGVPLPAASPLQAAVPAGPPPPAWARLQAAACAHPDEAVVSAVAACREADRRWGGGPVWRAAAARLLA